MEQVDVRILDRDYKLAVAGSERTQLLDAANLVDGRMRAIRDAGRVSGVERIAVMAALQLAHELLSAPAASGDDVPAGETVRRIRRISDEIDAEAKRQESLF
jgi:cell division protein ZapA